MSDRGNPHGENKSDGDRPGQTDNELLLAQQLSDFEISSAGDDLPESILAHLSPEEIEQFMQAREGLALLNRATTNQDQYEPQTLDDRAVDTLDQWQHADIESIPKRIGRFEIKEELGRGGFGLVLKASDPRLNRDIALKIPRATSLLQPELLKRFQREARAAALLSHPGIVPIFETGQVGPILYIAYEYVDGPTLSEFIRNETSIDPVRAARFARDLAEAVQYAHSRGLVHRDIKPANVMVDSRSKSDDSPEPTSASPVLRITDFGLADLQNDSEKLTAENALAGTPSYMSPEQVDGKAATTCSDVYALGIVLYELLTRTVPFQGQTNIEIARKVSEEQPTPVRKYNPTVPIDLSAICHKCLEKNPTARYASAQELADDLQAFLDGRPVNAREIGPVGRLVRWSQRNPLLSASLSGLLIVLVVGIISTSFFWRRSEDARILSDKQKKIAEVKSKEALTQAQMTREAIDQLYRSIANEPAIHEQGMDSFKLGLAVSARQYYQRLSKTRPTDLDVLSEYVDTLRGLALMLQRTGSQKDSIVIWRDASDIVAEHFPDQLLRWVALRSKLSEDLIYTGKLDEGVKVANELVDRLKVARESGNVADGSLDKLTKQLVVQLINAAQNLARADRFTEAEKAVDEAYALAVVTTGKSAEQWPVDRIWARVLRCQAEIADMQNEWKPINVAAPLAIELYEELLKEPSRMSEALSSLSILHQYLANAHRLQKDYALAIAEHETSREYLEQLLERHPDVGGLKFNWSIHVYKQARVLFEAEQFDEAFQQMSKHLPWIDEQRQTYPQLRWAWLNAEMDCRELMAKLFAKREEFNEALTELDRSIEICQSIIQSGQADIGKSAFLGHLYNEKAWVHLLQYENEQAQGWVEKSIDILEPLVEDNKGGSDAITYLQRARSLQNGINQPPENR